MKYPVNIKRGLRQAGKSTPMEKFSFGLMIGILLNVGIYFLLNSYFASIGISSVVLIFLILVLDIVIGIWLFRTFIVRENDKLKEHDSAKDTSLNSYYYIRDKENQDLVDNIPVYQFTDGSYFLLIQFKYGASNDKKSSESFVLMQNFFRNVLFNKLELRVYNMPEIFEESVECRAFINNLEYIDYKPLGDALLNMYNQVLNECSMYRQMFETTVMVRTTSPIQVKYFKGIINALFSEFYKNESSFRSINVLKKEEMRNFIRDYYCLDALDLASLKIGNLSKDVLLGFKDRVKVYQINLNSGKIVHKSNISLDIKGGCKID